MELFVIFWYGILHAFGPDHLTAIADFSIGKDKKKTLLITFLFAIGHGFSLFVFAKILQNMEISDNILAYGDIISAVVIIGMGLYILFMVYSNRIHLRNTLTMEKSISIYGMEESIHTILRRPHHLQWGFDGYRWST